MDLSDRAYCNRVLHIDLTTGSVEKTPLPDGIMEFILGGKGLGAWLLYMQQKSGIDPLSPENHLIFHNGPLTGTTAPTSGRFGCTTRSPATGTYCDSYCGGYWGSKLKYAGYDALVLTGKANHPCILVLDNQRVELKDADFLWGLNIKETSQRLKEEFGAEWQSLVIGPPGEKKRYIAGIFNETRALARGGVGAVMGSKNLKAILVRGDGYVRVHNPDEYRRALQLAFRAVRMSSETSLLSREGTANILDIVNVMGALPTRNFQKGSFELSDELTGSAFLENEWVKDYACFACPIACGKYTRTSPEGIYIEGPEYETIFAFGPNCAIASREAIIHLNWLCDEYGLDTISAGGIVAFVMEMYERNIISSQDLDGIEARFGDAKAAISLVRKMARVEGCGEWLAQGVINIVQKYPQAEPFAMHVKGLEMPAYHPNAAKGIALAYAVSERGACHLRGAPLGELFSGSADPLAVAGKAQLFRDHQAEKAVWDSACLCSFPGYGMKLKELWQLINAATGFEYATVLDLELVGERISTLARAFNVREGYKREHDTLPSRNLDQPMSSGPAEGHVVELASLLDDYYQIVGWDQDGIPSEERIQALKLTSILRN